MTSFLDHSRCRRVAGRLRRGLSRAVALLVVSAGGLMVGWCAAADFEGETVTIVVPYSAGGGTDLYARVVARHVGRHLPGEPEVIVENRPGAAGAVGMNYLLLAAPRDGFTIVIDSRAGVFDQVLGRSQLAADVRVIQWLGAPTTFAAACYVSDATGATTLDDVAAGSDTISMGGLRRGFFQSDLPLMLNRFAGTRFRVVAGYDGTSAVNLAVRQGEVDGLCAPIETMRNAAPDLLDGRGSPRLNPVVVLGKPDLSLSPELADVPRVESVSDDADARAVLSLYAGVYEAYRPFLAPPGVSAKRVEQLRAA
ncbi:MAG: hypothetical protein DWQ08_15515, partial [Proteobacteria bacterium]